MAVNDDLYLVHSLLVWNQKTRFSRKGSGKVNLTSDLPVYASLGKSSFAKSSRMAMLELRAG